MVRVFIIAASALAASVVTAAAQGAAVPMIDAPVNAASGVKGSMTPSSAPSSAPSSTAKATQRQRDCTRLPLSDIQVGKDETIRVARLRLDEYVAQVGAKKGWKTWDKSQETISCEDYLYLPLVGQEYKCFVTATFCKKS